MTKKIIRAMITRKNKEQEMALLTKPAGFFTGFFLIVGIYGTPWPLLPGICFLSTKLFKFFIVDFF